MEEIAKKGIMAGLISAVAFLYDSLGILFVILTFLMILDYGTGVISSYIQKTQSSRTGIIGILKKVCYIALVVTAILFDLTIIQATEQIEIPIPIGVTFFSTAVTCWLISNEALSIIENLDEIGVPTPKFLKPVVEKVKTFFENPPNNEGGK